MTIKRVFSTILNSAAMLLICGHAIAAPAPTQADIDNVNAGIKSSDKGPQDAAIAQIKDLIASAHPVRNLWVDWIPGLMKDGRNEDAAELALLGSCERPDLNAIVPKNVSIRSWDSQCQSDFLRGR